MEANDTAGVVLVFSRVPEVLRNFDSLERLAESKWYSACMVRRYQAENSNVTPLSFLKQVFTAELNILAVESRDYGDILKGRFVEGFPSTKCRRANVLIFVR